MGLAKRVLVFRPSLGDGGADRITVTLLHELDRARFAPTLVLVRRTGALVDEVPADVPVVELGVRRLAFAVPALARAIRRLAPDVIFATSSGANPVAVLARALARSRAHLVLSQRSAVVPATFGSARAALEVPLKRLTYRRADLVTAVSDGVGDDLVARLGLSRDQIRVVYNPVIGRDLAARTAAPVDHPWFARDAAPVLVAVGRLTAHKDYPTMFDALVALRRTHPVRLAILGLGPLRATLEREVAVRGLAGEVEFLGFDPNPYRYLARAALAVQTSRVEGLPGTIIQAMACGTPVVATDCDFGPREVITDGRDGYLVPVGDAAQVAARLAQLLDQPALRARMSAAAAQSARRYELAGSVARYEAALDA